MRHLIVRAAAGLKGEIEISEGRYSQIQEAKASLLLFLGIEEKSSILLDNLGDYEKALLGLIVDRITYYDNTMIGFRSDLMLINRMLTNVLSSAKLYIDQVKHDLASIFGTDSQYFKDLEDFFNDAYDTSLGYRAMEAVRNYIQHRAFPVHVLSYPPEFQDKYAKSSEVAILILPKMIIERLQKDTKFKRSVLTELSEIGDEIPITPLLREYVGCLGEIQNRIRKMCNSQLVEWEEMLNAVITEAENTFEEKPTLALAVVQEASKGRWPEITYIFREVYELRKIYERRNYINRGRSRAYASGATLQKE